VLLNLIGNAIKFTDIGGVLVTVSMIADTDTPRLRFAIADTGPGLKQEDLGRIFEDFEQADGSSTRRYGGAGLGLAISRRLVTSMGGTIAVTSTLGEGSEFVLEIPATAAVANTQVRDGVLTGRRAVILTRNRIEGEALKRTILAHGGEAEIAGTVEQAESLAAGCETLLVDAVLEEGEGRTLRRLRNAGFAKAEAITLIAPTDRGALGDFRAFGYSTFLARPVRGETLLRALLAGLSSPAETPPEQVDFTKSRTAAGRATRPGLSILLAEDNDINALLARAALQRAGHRVDVVGNGKAAVDALIDPARKRRYDMVLMDLHMPVMDGMDAIALIRRHEEEAGMSPISIMVLSADNQETTRHAVLAHGASGFVTKPLDPEVLVRTVEAQAAA